jgi:4-carboxymuconolactone decarboxylase
VRLPPPARHDLPSEVADLVDLATPPGGRPPPTISVLSHQPALLGPFLTWAAALALRGVIPRRDHEILALRTAWLVDSTFEWNEHVAFGHDAGLTDDEIEQIKGDADADDWAPHEAALVRATDELLTDHDISDDTWNSLAAHFSPGALIEIPYVIGQYAMLSMVANVIGA